MITYRYHSAYIRIVQDGLLLTLTYGGPMNRAAFEFLRSKALSHLGLAMVLLIDMRAVVPLSMDFSCHDGVYSPDSPPAAVLVSHGQVALWSGYALKAAMHGVARAVFTCAIEALAWAQARARARARVLTTASPVVA